MTREHVVALASLVLASLLVLLAARYVPYTPAVTTTVTTTSTTTVYATVTPIHAETTTRPQTLPAPLAEESRASLSSQVEALLEKLAVPSATPRYPHPSTVTTTLTVTVAPSIPPAARALKTVEESLGTHVAVTGVDELDYVKLLGGILHVAGRGEPLVYRVDLDALKPLDPLSLEELLEPLEARIEVSVAGRMVVNRSFEPRTGGLGLVGLGDGLVAVTARLYYPWWLMLPVTQASLVAVYNGSRLVCSAVINGSLVDARGYDGVLWLLTVRHVYRVLGVQAPVEDGATARDAGLIVYLLDSKRCRLYRFALPRPPLRALLLVEPGGVAYLAASYWSPQRPQTLLFRLVYNESGLAAVNATSLEGLLPGNWLALIPYEGRLLALLEDAKGFTLYTLDAESLEVRAELRVPRPREAVHAVKLIGGRLYVVTYRRVDPLFVIDVGDPDNPRILGWRRGPGFDQILEPLWGNLVLGIGYEKGMLRVTVYRVAENYSLVPVDKRLLRAWGYMLLAPWGYRFLAKGEGIVTYPVAEGSARKVLVARISENGTIEAVKLLEGERALLYKGRLVVVERESVALYDPTSFRKVGEAPLKP